MSSSTLISPSDLTVDTMLHAPANIIETPPIPESIKSTPQIKPVRVAQVIYRWSRCGLELQLANQIRCFDPNQIESWVASSMPPEPQVPDVPQGVAVRAYDQQRDSSSFREWLTERLRDTATDVVHARGLWMLPETLAAARAAGNLPVVFSFHGFDDASRHVFWWRRRLWRRAMYRCAAVVTVSQATRMDLARTLSFPENQIQVILNGVDTDYFLPPHNRDSSRQQLGIHDDRPVLLCVGSLVPVKGYDVLIESLGRTLKSGRLAVGSAHLIVVGTDHLSGQLQMQAQQQLRGMDVRWIGGIKDVRPFYHAADALLMPSRSEGLSNVILEAMACGLPVVASAVGGLPEQIVDGRTGWLVPGGDSQRLGEAILDLLDNPAEARRRGREGRRHVLRHFRLARAARQFESLYTHIGGKSAGCSDSSSHARCWPLNDERLQWYAYARVAWWHLLTSLHLKPGDNILMPDLICDVMTDPMRQLGLVPRYYTSEPLGTITADDLAPYVDDRTRAVLAVHYFGMPRNLGEVAAYCRMQGLLLIEDASQTIFSNDGNCPVGHYGDAVLFSFRKILGLPHGAGLICNNVMLQHAIEQTPVTLSTPRRDIWRHWMKHVDQKCLGGRCEKLLDAFRSRRFSRWGEAEESLSSHPDPFDRCLVSPSRTARWLASRWNIEAEISRRRELFSILASRWVEEQLPGRPLLEDLPDGWVPYAFVINPDQSDADTLVRNLQARGLIAEPWPRLPEDAPSQTIHRRRVLIRF